MNEYIEKEVAIENSNLKEVWFSNRYAMIHSILSGNQNVGSVIIPNPVKRICNGAFSRCEELTSVSLPDSLCSIGSCAFLRCRKLSSITIPRNVTELGSFIFGGCWNLTSVTILGSVLPDFSTCRKLSTIIIGENLKEFDVNSFSSCKNIKTIVVDKNNQLYDSRDNCNAIIETKSNTLILGCNSSIIPNGIKSIREGAFTACGRMRNISLPESLEHIGSIPISIQKIHIPKGSMGKFRQLLPYRKKQLIEV